MELQGLETVVQKIHKLRQKGELSEEIYRSLIDDLDAFERYLLAVQGNSKTTWRAVSKNKFEYPSSLELGRMAKNKK